MHYQFANFSPAEFLAEYWQKKPVLIKGAFTHFIDPIDADELAGLACEEEVESRVISKNKQKQTFTKRAFTKRAQKNKFNSKQTDIKQADQWQVEHGPFTQFDHLGENDWTLLVQAVDHWSTAGADLIRPFRFIPNWRVDDLMVSFSTPGGGVGAHVDQYDVFILQGMGKRHWRVGLQQPLEDKIPHPDLLQVTGFEACIDEILESGDLLYIPPGCPHEGYAIEPALNYSIGFRAPNQQDLISSFADYALQEECYTQRYVDPNLSLRTNPSVILDTEIEQIRQLMLSTIAESSGFNQWLGCYLTQAKHELDMQALEPAYLPEALFKIVNQVEIWHRLGGLRCVIIDNDLYINGEKIDLLSTQSQFAHYLSDNDQYLATELKNMLTDVDNLTLFTALVNEGMIFSEELFDDDNLDDNED